MIGEELADGVASTYMSAARLEGAYEATAEVVIQVESNTAEACGETARVEGDGELCSYLRCGTASESYSVWY